MVDPLTATRAHTYVRRTCMCECVRVYLSVCLRLCVCAICAICAICASRVTQMGGQGVAGLRMEVFAKWNSYR